jgi:mycothiol synthase
VDRGGLQPFALRPAEPADAAGVTAVVAGLETRLYGTAGYTQADLEDEWRELDLARDTIVLVDGDRIVGYGAVWPRGELWRLEGFVHPDALGRGAGAQLVAAMERDVAGRGARRVQIGVFEPDDPAQRLLAGRGYRAVRVFRELRIELLEPPAPPRWPDGLRGDSFDPTQDARAFHAAQQEAFSDHWEHTPRTFAAWSTWHLESSGFDPTLWCVVREGDEIAAGTICQAGRYGGGWVSVLFTRRRWRRRGVGAGLLQDAFGRFWARGEGSVGLTADAQSATGAFRLYERAGMRTTLGWVMFEKPLEP